jgi:putative membrane protein
MTLRWLLAAIHLLALGIALGAVVARGLALRHVGVERSLQRAFLADNYWGVSAILFIVTGLLRLFGEYEKTISYYLSSTMFWIKMGLLVAILLLEIWPMMTLIRWRFQVRANEPIDTKPAGRIATVSYIQSLLLVLMVFAATAIARGYGF